MRGEFAAQVDQPIQGEKSSPPAQGRSPAPPTLCDLTWQVTLPDAKQLRLSEDAVLHMRRIVDEFSYATGDNTPRGSTKQRLHQLLFDFFDTFGSHVFRRPACGACGSLPRLPHSKDTQFSWHAFTRS